MDSHNFQDLPDSDVHLKNQYVRDFNATHDFWDFLDTEMDS